MSALHPAHTCPTLTSQLHLSSAASPQQPETKTWIDLLPVVVRPYVRLCHIDRPSEAGILLLYYPCGRYLLVFTSLYWHLTKYAAWSITMASYAHKLPYMIPSTYLSLLGIGAVVMCGTGNTIDDMWDKDFDKAVGLFNSWLTVKQDLY